MMAVLSVNKMWSRYGSSLNAETMTIETAYQIVVEADPETTLYEIYSAPGLPAMGSAYDDVFLGVTAKDARVERVSPIMYVMTISYEGKSQGEQSDPVSISWSDTESDEPIDRDWTGRAICTANGEPIEGVTMKLADQVVTIQRQFLGFSPWLTHQYRHSVNSDTFMGYPPGTARLTGFSATMANANINSVGEKWDVSATIQFRFPYGDTLPSKAWYARVLHQGYWIRTSNRFRRALDIDVAPPGVTGAGEPCVKPVLLTPTGEVETDPNNANFLYFQIYGELPYSVLGLV
jgi:hypothetical protein